LNRFEQANIHILRSLALLGGEPPCYERVFAHFALGFLQIWQARYPEAWGNLTTCISLADQMKDRWSAAWARQGLTEIAYESGQLGQNITPFLENLAHFEQIGDKRGCSRVLNYLSIAAMAQEQYAQAQEYLERLIEIEEKIGDIWGTAGGYSKLGQLAAARGDIAQAVRYYKQGLGLLQKTGDQRRIAYLLADLGEMFAITGDSGEANVNFHQALIIACNSQNLSLAQHILACRASACLALHQTAQAADLLDLAAAFPLVDRGISRRVARLASALPVFALNRPKTNGVAGDLWKAIEDALGKTVNDPEDESLAIQDQIA
jgi:tetratricopeptide (TPR) repeat protein